MKKRAARNHRLDGPERPCPVEIRELVEAVLALAA